MGRDLAVSVIVPAFRAEDFLARAVRSALAQDVDDLEVVVAADDQADYAAVLRHVGVPLERVVLVRTGGTGTGCARARNVALRAARHPIVAMLDADDVLHPDKLRLMAPLAREHGCCACALDHGELGASGGLALALTLGTHTPSGLLNADAYLATHPTANAMLVFDRRRLSLEWREDLPALEDIVFSAAALSALGGIFHVQQALHTYARTPGSMSVGAAGAVRMIGAKEELLTRLSQDGLGIANAAVRASLRRYMVRSLEVERAHAAALARGEASSFLERLLEALGSARRP